MHRERIVASASQSVENAASPDRRAALAFCPASAAARVLTGRWKPAIVFHLLDGAMHFAGLRRAIPGVSHQMLSVHLRELEADGIVYREPTGTPPAPVRYSLTPRGAQLRAAILALEAWGLTAAEA